MDRKKKREIIEWVAIILVFGTLYFTGWHTEVFGQLQRLVVATGVMQAEVIDDNAQENADYGFLLEDVDGKTVHFESLKNKTVFLNFWATWCPPCIAEMPDIHDLYLSVGDQPNVSFVMVSLDEDFEKAKAFVERKGYTFPIYRLKTKRPEIFQSQSIPTTFIISKSGKIVVKRSGMAQYDNEEIRGILLGE